MTTDAAVGGDTRGPDPGHERWYLNDQREFLLRSIDDAEREHGAGDLAEADYAVLMLRDRARLADVEAELAALGPERPEPAVATSPADPKRRPRMGSWRRAGIVTACLLIATGAVILVGHAVSPGLPGQAVSGSITLSKVQLIEQQLIDAGSLNNEGEAVAALQLYEKVLSEDPTDPNALAASGWLEWNAGTADRSPSVEALGRSAEKKAIHFAPGNYAGHLYLGLIIYNQDHNPTGAIAQFTEFLADGPSKAEIKSVARLVAPAYVQAKQPLPPALGITTTTPATTSAP